MNYKDRGLLNNCFILFLVAGAGFVQDPTIKKWVWGNAWARNRRYLHLDFAIIWYALNWWKPNNFWINF